MENKLIIIYPFRDRDLLRVKKSLDSLASQTNQFFHVYFVDYGSNRLLAEQVKELVTSYSFVTYEYHYTEQQPWNKSKALNSIIKRTVSGFCLVADIDMIFHSGFVAKAIVLQESNKAVFFQVGFLNNEETLKDIFFDDYKIDFKSTEGATGITMFPVEALKAIRGFDEFYHFWGAEDSDVHLRLKNNGVVIEYYDKEVLMLHQWHPSYRSKERNNLTQSLQVKGVVQLNHYHLQYAAKNDITKVNPICWGEIMGEDAFKEINSDSVKKIRLQNIKKEVEHLVLVQLAQISSPVCFEIKEDTFKKTLKYWIKRILGKKVPAYFTMKEVNDMILLQLVAHYNYFPYTYTVSKDLKKIELRITKKN